MSLMVWRLCCLDRLRSGGRSRPKVEGEEPGGLQVEKGGRSIIAMFQVLGVCVAWIDRSLELSPDWESD